jgi:hypothetical protein
METLLFDCLNCKERVEHSSQVTHLATFLKAWYSFNASSCDVFSVKQLRNAKSHKEAGISRCSCGSWIIEGVACLVCARLDAPFNWEKK